MKFKKILGILIKRILSFFRVSNKERGVEQSHVEIKKARVAEAIFDDSKLKTNEKLYLIILIRAFNTSLGYAEISNKEIMKAASCSNNKTIIDVINRLEKNGYIKRVENQRGKIGKYNILRHIEFSDESNHNIFSDKICNYNFNSIKANNNDLIEVYDKEIVSSKENIDENNANGFFILEKNIDINRVEDQGGKASKDNIFSNKVYNDDFNSIKSMDSNLIKRYNKETIDSKEDLDEIDANSFLEKIQNDVRISCEILGELVNINNNIDEEIDIFFKKNNKFE